jgi:crossover junction endodeoxyribonuclease RuvC
MRYIVGIDPGLSGGIAFYDDVEGELDTLAMPTLKAGTGTKSIIDETTLACLFDDKRPYIRKVYIEQVNAMPKQGVTSTFNFGMGFGILRGIVAANILPVEFVRPNTWKKALNVPANKDSARLRASQIFPQYANQWSLKKWDGRAEAALIAYYGAK